LNGPLDGVSETALGAAEMRAEESRRPDRLFDDPYAAAFVAAAPPLFPDIPSLSDGAELAALVEASIAGIAVRTRFFDNYLARAVSAGCRQVVLLAAGLDARAFRLDWPKGVRIFELDLPELFAFKEPVLAREGATARCERRVVAADFREDWPARLTDAGFDPAVASAWTAEGLLVYLSNDDGVRLLTAVGELSARHSELSLDYEESADTSSLNRVRAMPGMRQVTSMWQGGLSDAASEWLRDHHWRVHTYSGSDLAREYGRAVPDGSAATCLTATLVA
jgi:methyltransferase (TIGR00027 family)